MQYKLEKQIIEVISTYSKNADLILGAWASVLLTDEQGEYLLQFANKMAEEKRNGVSNA